MDVLSEVLRAVKLEGALFFNGEFSAPWCLRSAKSTDLAPYLSPKAGHLIIYHFLTEGRAYARLPEGPHEELTAGDIVITATGAGGVQTRVWTAVATPPAGDSSGAPFSFSIAGAVTQGMKIGQVALEFGADDMGSVMIEENVVSAAGTTHRSTTDEFIRAIRALGKTPVQRDTLYREVRVWN